MRAACLLLLAASSAPAAPPTIDIPAEVKPAGDYALLLPKTDAVSVTYVGLSGVDALPSVLLKDPRQFVLQTRALAPGRYKFAAVGASKDGEQTRVDFVVQVGDAPPVPPGPTPPGPTPPAPGPVTSFRAFLVYESGAVVTQAQFGVLYGVSVERALDAATAGDRSQFAWRRLDRDARPDTLPAGLREAWTLAKPKVKSVPAVVFQVNGGEPVVEPLPPNVAAAEALVSKYRGK